MCESELLARSIGDLPEGYAGTILKKTDVGTEPGTTFVEVSYRDTDAERAHRIANAIGEKFSGQVSELNVSATPVTAQVWQGATLPGTPVSPGPLLNAALALVIGPVLAIGLAFLLESLDYGGTPGGRGRTGPTRVPRFRYNPAVRGSDEQKGKQ